jgi:hypothetical protein
MDSGQLNRLRQQQFQEGSEQPFAAKADEFVHELKETQVQRQPGQSHLNFESN